ncbi:MAG: DegT/DnrJ/EryC1/StrS family aminotransferase [Bacteroidota bacterium]|nr:DegT/DnrJ/EryC1/StrS family aminotransferase [Bacteroidota bacterium]MDP4231942.1 DegT/DnrJ/EryC1/StrS family aminotransferase [Bacteroidota bacterium]MDP4241351.1 DegT/DnrJ/EryC1/StrS family aminotransferase [Bacteroidota bacterium]MDP4287272.1 DegT/DnrJ/EryC1/StrS family aminotransferase [Bacteroidota bacterium]
MKVEFYKHPLGDDEIDSLTDVIHSTFLTTGPRTREFEAQFARYLRAEHAVGVTSWTMGGFIALKTLGIGPGDEVITTPMTFMATANIIIECGAKPVFVDVEPETGNISCDEIEKAITPRTRAILPVHLYGQMCDMRRMSEIARKHKLAIIEDCAHSVESERDGVRPGELSDMAVFSFYATKNLASGEGGAITTNNQDLYEKLMVLRQHGMNKSAADRYSARFKHYDMETLGYKCNMFDIQAAMLLPQLPRLAERLERREAICTRYAEGFRNAEGISFPSVLPGSVHGRHLFTIWVDPLIRDEVLNDLQDRGIGVAVNFRSINRLTYYRTQLALPEGSFPVAERIGDSTITLPLYTKLKEEEIDYVIEQTIESVNQIMSLRVATTERRSNLAQV